VNENFCMPPARSRITLEPSDSLAERPQLSIPAERFTSADLPRGLLLGALRAAGTTLRLAILALLVVLEPVVRVVLAGSALLVALTALFFALVRPLSAFPLWGMLAVTAALVMLLALYYAILRAMSR
jgi:hypothetical protein